MKNNLGYLLTVPFILFFTLHCSKSPPPTPSLHTESQEGASWSVKLVSTCETGAAEDCSAAQGFSVSSDGTFIVGPGPQNQILTGHIKEAELTHLTQEISSVLDSLETHTETCIAPFSHNVRDVVSIRHYETEQELLRSSNSEYCYRTSTLEASKPIWSIIKGLATQYYPLPFPRSSCTQAMSSLEGLYAEVSKCTTNQDCLYIDATFDPISRETFTFLAINECSSVKPLLVGNPTLLGSNKTELLRLFNEASRTCNQGNTNMNCSGFAAFQPTAPAAICNAGTCKPAPAASGP